MGIFRRVGSAPEAGSRSTGLTMSRVRTGVDGCLLPLGRKCSSTAHYPVRPWRGQWEPTRWRIEEEPSCAGLMRTRPSRPTFSARVAPLLGHPATVDRRIATTTGQRASANRRPCAWFDARTGAALSGALADTQAGHDVAQPLRMQTGRCSAGGGSSIQSNRRRWSSGLEGSVDWRACRERPSRSPRDEFLSRIGSSPRSGCGTGSIPVPV
jgi:hypothetical protein